MRVTDISIRLFRPDELSEAEAIEDLASALELSAASVRRHGLSHCIIADPGGTPIAEITTYGTEAAEEHNP